MDFLDDCQSIDFGAVHPGKIYKKKIKITANASVQEVIPANCSHPFDEAFNVKRDPRFESVRESRFIIEFHPVLPRQKSFGGMTVTFENGSSRKFCFRGETTGSEMKFSAKKIYFLTNAQTPSSRYQLVLKNSGSCSDSFCWDYTPEGSQIEITPRIGVVQSKSHVQATIRFIPKKPGLFYRAIPCLFTYHEPLFLEIFGFHSKLDLKLDLERYIQSNAPLPKYRNNYFRYMVDIGLDSNSIVTQSTRIIHFGSSPLQRGTNELVETVLLTNHEAKDLVVSWDIPQESGFHIQPSKAILPRLGGKETFVVTFRPHVPELYYSTEAHASFSWGDRREFMVPFCVTLLLTGDSFSNEGCGWGPKFRVDRTRIILPGTIPNVPSFMPFAIFKTGDLPIHFQLKPISESKHFIVKPIEGVLKADFQIIIVQLSPNDGVEVNYTEEWVLIVNKFAKVKLEFCGTSELPFLRAGENKDVKFPATTVGCITCQTVPVINPTRLELEYSFRNDSAGQLLVDDETRIIGPGEIQWVRVCYKSDRLGPYRAALGVPFKWVPRHSGALRSTEGKQDYNSETVLYFSGITDELDVHVSTDNLIMSHVFLNEWATGSFILTHKGMSKAHIKLDCIECSRFSRIGKTKIAPRYINLNPDQPVEVKIKMVGIQRGRNVFMIRYSLYESELFEKPVSAWRNLLPGAVLVYFSSLRVLDIRYDGLAKSLSKHFLWSLLEINRLNKFLDKLEDINDDKCISVSVPLYISGSPPLKIELLIKNTCLSQLELNVQTIKNCFCHPRPNDSISRRQLDYSCEHDGLVSASFQESQLPSGKTAILSVVVDFATNVECMYSILLTVSRTSGGEKVDRCVRISIERGIIPLLDNKSLRFLLPSRYCGSKQFDCRFEDVCFGDSSNYVQVIWMYNHAQRDIRFWTEWLYVNRRIFRIINPRTMLHAHSCQPLFIQFTPFEMKTYHATMAVVNEIGEEFHINITGRGAEQPQRTTVPMLNKMPAQSLFEDPLGDLQLSVDHITIRPMPTHSYDKYIFFVKNNSNDVIHYQWDSLYVWSTLEVNIQPMEGELQAGEIYPFQMHVHTFRLPAIFNFAVELSYFNKSVYNRYWQKSSTLGKSTRAFDSCFVLLPDEEIDVAYHNPKFKWEANEPPRNKMLAIGGSIMIFDRVHIDVVLPTLAQQIRHIPTGKLRIKRVQSQHGLKRDDSAILSKTLQRIVRTTVESVMFQEGMKRKRPSHRYISLPDKPCTVLPKLSGRALSMLLCNILYSTVIKLFGLETGIYHEHSEAVQRTHKLTGRMLRVYNPYYERMLRHGIDQACVPPATARIKRALSRDNLAIVHRMSL